MIFIDKRLGKIEENRNVWFLEKTFLFFKKQNNSGRLFFSPAEVFNLQKAGCKKQETVISDLRLSIADLTNHMLQATSQEYMFLFRKTDVKLKEAMMAFRTPYNEQYHKNTAKMAVLQENERRQIKNSGAGIR